VIRTLLAFFILFQTVSIQSTFAAISNELSPKLEKQILNEWKSQLEKYEFTQEHFIFLQKQKKDFIQFSEPGKGGLTIDNYFTSELDGIYVNRDPLNRFIGSRLKALSVKSEFIPTIVARKTLPFLTHEICHSITREKVEVQLHFVYPISSLESELICYVDQLRVLVKLTKVDKTILEEYPNNSFDRLHRSLISAWEASFEELVMLIQKSYGGSSLHLQTREDLLQKYSEDLIRYQVVLNQNPQDDNSRRYTERLTKGLPILQNPEQFESLRSYFQEEITKMKDEWGNLFWQIWRKQRINYHIQEVKKNPPEIFEDDNRSGVSHIIALLKMYDRLPPGRSLEWVFELRDVAKSIIYFLFDEFDKIDSYQNPTQGQIELENQKVRIFEKFSELTPGNEERLKEVYEKLTRRRLEQAEWCFKVQRTLSQVTLFQPNGFCEELLKDAESFGQKAVVE